MPHAMLMNKHSQHYASLLAPVYLWMVGGMAAALERGRAEVEPLSTPGVAAPTAIDLGAGFGMHAIPLAQMGYAVTAIDSSPLLLSTLADHAPGLAIQTVQGDLIEFATYVKTAADLILCMGDTLTHLSSQADVATLFQRVHQALKPGGRFAASFRDYSTPRAGHDRFIPVKADDERILTCFLEYGAGHVTVHDILHERKEGTWQMKLSSYEKVMLSPAWVCESLAGLGFDVTSHVDQRGMTHVLATR